MGSGGRRHVDVFVPPRQRGVVRCFQVEAVVDVEGTEYVAIFAKIAVNVLRRPGNPRNELGTVLKQWFGPDAGLPGTNFRVVFRSTQADGRSSSSISHHCTRGALRPPPDSRADEEGANY